MEQNTAQSPRSLARLQVGTIALHIVAMFAALAIYHHLSEDYFVPWSSFFFSLKLVWPPIIIAVVSYVAAILTGKQFSEAGKVLVRYLRNSFFQSRRQMWLSCVASVLMCGAFILMHVFVTPPHYSSVVRRLLGGESDDFQVVDASIERIRELNPEYADLIKFAREVFHTRSQMNFAGTPAKARMLIRSLEGMEKWKNHPLRKHALAEAYSIAAQAATVPNAFGTANSGVVSNYYAKSISLYDEVVMSRSPLATKLLRYSALNNIGNQYYYQRRYGEAVEQWRKANEPHNTSAWGNIVAGLVKMKQYEQAVLEAKDARTWAESAGKALLEPSAYSSIAANAAVACWHLDRSQEGLDFARDALAVMNDALNQVNFAYALVFANRADDAIRFLRTVSIPLSEANQSAWVSEGARDYGHQLIWALADQAAPVSLKAARLHAFLKEAYTEDDLAKFSEDELRKTVEKALSKSADVSWLCADLLQIRATQRRLRALVKPTLSPAGPSGEHSEDAG